MASLQPPEKKMQAVIYARYSSSAQREESIEGQIMVCTDYAKRKGIDIVGTYVDNAKSGKEATRRTSFLKMIQDSKDGLFDTVLVYKTNRFARDRYDAAIYRKALNDNGVQIISATEAVSNSPEGILIQSLLDGLSEYYLVELRQNVIRGHHVNAEKCLSNGGVIPLGYKVGPDHRFEIDEDGANTVRTIFALYENGNSIAEVIRKVNQMGLRNRQGNPFTRNSLSTILKNIRYTGVYKYGDIEKEGGMPQIIEKRQFQEVQRLLGKNKLNASHNKAKTLYLLSGKIYCGECGARMIGESGHGKNGNSYNYYKCATQKSGKHCSVKPIRQESLEKQILSNIYFVMNDDLLENVADKVVKYQKEKADGESMLPQFIKQQMDAKKKLENLIKAVEEGMSVAPLIERMHDLEILIDDLEVSIKKEKILRDNMPTKEQIVYFLLQMKDIDISDVKGRVALVDSFIHSIFVYNDKICINFNYGVPQAESTLKCSSDCTGCTTIENNKAESVSKYDKKSCSDTPVMVDHQGLEPWTP